MSDIAIRVENLSKLYRIGTRDEQPRGLVQAALSLAASPFAYLQRMRRPPTEEETLWALKDVSFEVKHGEVLGIIGRNGAGKSTLLKILSRITEPSSGEAQVFGRVGSLLEVGTGFHPELTGRENIYLNGAILGMKRIEIDRKFDEIVDFSGVEKFLDTPVKRYSSGMYVRLAFAVAAHLEPEILLVDEVLAVGDIAFQKKCLGKMEDIAKVGRTVLFVTHNLGSIEVLCPRSMLLQEGRIAADGQSLRMISRYMESLDSRTSSDSRPLWLPVVFRRVYISVPEGRLGSWSSCLIQAELDATIPVTRCFVNLIVDDLQGRHCIHLRTDYDNLFPDFEPGLHLITMEISSLNLEGGKYVAWFRLVSEKDNVIVDSDRVFLNIEKGYERYEAVGAVVAVRHAWRWSQI